MPVVKEWRVLVAKVVVVIKSEREKKGGKIIDAQPRTGNSGQERKKNTQGIKRKRKRNYPQHTVRD